METKTLNAQKREQKGRKTYIIKGEGKVPAVVYGAGVEIPLNISVDRNEFVKVYEKAGESTIVELSIEGDKAVNVLIKDYQIDALRDEVIHIDFFAVDMNKPIEADVKLRFVGESIAVKGLGGTLVSPQESVLVRALPKDLVSYIDVDLSTLATFDDAVHISDIIVPEGITILEKPDLTVALVSPPRSDTEMAKLDEAVEPVVQPEVEGEKKEGDEEVTEGAETEKEDKKDEK
ncbi:MAG: 50S ribosomal protein L25 [Patescibacteria group bacterium]